MLIHRLGVFQHSVARYRGVFGSERSNKTWPENKRDSERLRVFFFLVGLFPGETMRKTFCFTSTESVEQVSAAVFLDYHRLI